MPFYPTRRSRYAARASMSSRKFNRNKGIYRSGVPGLRKARAVISQAGIPSAAIRMTAGMPAAQEIKYFDTNVIDPINSDWSFLASTLCAVPEGTGVSQRIGRQIRVVGISYRLSCNTGTSTAPVCPVTVDFVCDKQANASPPPLFNTVGPPAVLNGVYSSNTSTALPNPLGQDRFSFLKRVETPNPNSNYTRMSGSVKCNKLVTYDSALGADVVTNNLFVTASSFGPIAPLPFFGGVFRILYVDA